MTEIDMRRRYWGHNFDIKPDAEGEYSGFMWSTPGPRVDDTVIWRTAYGLARAHVHYVRWVGNVDDMYRIKLTIVDRIMDIAGVGGSD